MTISKKTKTITHHIRNIGNNPSRPRIQLDHIIREPPRDPPPLPRPILCRLPARSGFRGFVGCGRHVEGSEDPLFDVGGVWHTGVFGDEVRTEDVHLG